MLKAAWMIDNSDAKAARNEIAMIKVVVPQMQLAVTDRAMQIFGAMGLSPDTPLPDLWTLGRSLQIADGPDEVHLRSIARGQIKAAQQGNRDTLAFITAPVRTEEISVRDDYVAAE